MKAVHAIVNQVKILRHAAGISQKEMAVKINIDVTNYRKLEAGKRKRLDVSQLLIIADALKSEQSVYDNPLQTALETCATVAIIMPSAEDIIHYQKIINHLWSIIDQQQLIIIEIEKALAARTISAIFKISDNKHVQRRSYS